MSARQPFVPQRPGSRISNPIASPNGVVQPPINDPFRHSGLLPDSSAAPDPGAAHKSQNTNKPLNISGLMKKKRGSQGLSDSKSSAGDQIVSQNHIAAPRPMSPFIAKNPIFLSEKQSLVSVSPAPHIQAPLNEDFSHNQAHIPTHRPSRHYSREANRQQQRLSPSVPTDNPDNGIYPPSGVTMNGALDHPSAQDQFNQSATRRPHVGSPSGGAEEPNPKYDGNSHGYEHEPNSRALRQSSNKRIDRPDDVGGDEMEYGSTKRQRGDRMNNEGQVRSNPELLASRSTYVLPSD